MSFFRSFRSQNAWPFVLLLPVTVYLLMIFIYPVLNIFWMSVSEPTLGISGYTEFFSTPVYLKALFRTFYVAFIVTIICLLLGYPLAYVIARKGGSLGLALLGIVAISFWTSFLVRTYAWMVILGASGPVIKVMEWLGISPKPQILYNSFSSYLGIIHILLPFMILTIYAVMRKIDPNYLRAATSLGASPIQRFVTVFFPLSLPGVVNGCTLVFIFTLGFYVTPVLLGGPGDTMIAGLIGQQINELLEWGVAGAMTTVLIVATLTILGVYNRFVGLNRLWG